MSSPSHRFSRSRSPSLSPVPFGSPRSASPISRPNSELDKTIRSESPDSSSPSSPNDRIISDEEMELTDAPTTPRNRNANLFPEEEPYSPSMPIDDILITPQGRNDTLFGDGDIPVPTTPQLPNDTVFITPREHNDTQFWVENTTVCTTPPSVEETPKDRNDTLFWDGNTATPNLSTPEQFSDPLCSTPSPLSVSPYSPLPIKRRRLDFNDHDSDDDGLESDVSEELGILHANDDANDAFIDEEKENDSGVAVNDPCIKPQSKEELFFTVRRSKNLTYFVAPFSPIPLLMKIKYPPNKNQISDLLSHGFEHARNLSDKKRFRNIAFRYELSCSAERRRELIKLTLARIESQQEYDGDQEVSKREKRRLSTMRRDLIEEDCEDNQSDTSFDSESDSRSEGSAEEWEDYLATQTDIRTRARELGESVNTLKKATVSTKATVSKKTVKQNTSTFSMISRFVKRPFAMWTRK